MGNPAYDARRAAEQAEAEKREAEAKAGKAALEALTDFLNGRAALHIDAKLPQGTMIRLVRDRTT